MLTRHKIRLLFLLYSDNFKWQGHPEGILKNASTLTFECDFFLNRELSATRNDSSIRYRSFLWSGLQYGHGDSLFRHLSPLSSLPAPGDALSFLPLLNLLLLGLHHL